ncbi:uncharacterized protein V6R79_007606 [Siganus canaliculatus]
MVTPWNRAARGQTGRRRHVFSRCQVPANKLPGSQRTGRRCQGKNGGVCAELSARNTTSKHTHSSSAAD